MHHRSLPMRLPALLALAALGVLAVSEGRAQGAGDTAATRRARVDADGVVRWTDTGEEAVLFGANYALPSSGDFRAAGRVTHDRKRLVDEDLAHFARMGWDGLRVAFWGDWQNADLQGNLIENEHLDLLDHLVAGARERGIYILFNPIHTYHAGWPDAMGDSFPGFAAHIPKDRLGTDPAAIAAQVNYVRQILGHVNPYTGVSLAEEPAILFIEMINEPVHHPEDLDGSVRYIDALAAAVRDAGSDAILLHNVSQDFRIAGAIRRSRVRGASFGWYPTGLNSGHELRGNHLRAVDDYPPMRIPELDGMAKVVYEFDSADQRTGTMYPAMVRAWRAGGAQFAAMFAYDMLRTASRNLGWQTHYLNLVYTPRKAMSAVVAAEAMRRLPRGGLPAPYPDNRAFGPFRVSYEEDLGEMAAADAFLYTGTTDTEPPAPERLTRVAGHGSSPVVAYEGEGVYFLDRVREGVWRLEVYPDAVPVDDPFGRPRLDRVVTRAIRRAWPMRIDLPDLGPSFTAQPVTAGNAEPSRAVEGRFVVRPGVYVLAADGPVDPATLPSRLGRLAFDEWVAPETDPLETRVLVRVPAEHVEGRPLEVEARVVTASPPDAVRFWLGAGARGGFRPFPMEPIHAYTWSVTLPPGALGPGLHRYLVSVREGDATTTFPGGVARSPDDWDFSVEEPGRLTVVGTATPLRLFEAGRDVERLSFSRVGDGWREGIFRLLPSEATGAPSLHLELPVDVGGITPDDYTTSLFVGDRVRSRGDAVRGADALRLRLRGLGPDQAVHVTLVEKDGTSWGARLTPGTAWSVITVPLGDLRVTRGVKLPQGFPGGWNYWLEPAAGRGGPGDGVRIGDVERLQVSLRAAEAGSAPLWGIEVESVTLHFGRAGTAPAGEGGS